MSIDSYAQYTCTFPTNTRFRKGADTEGLRTNKNGDYEISRELEGWHSETFLSELVELFDVPLDKVTGLYLDASYHYYEDDDWQFMIQIKNGRVTSSQTEIVWRDCTPESAGVDIGRPMVDAAKAAWKRLEDVPVDDNGNIEDRVWMFQLERVYEKGTNREEIWHDIEDMLHVSVAYLMGEAKNPDGTN